MTGVQTWLFRSIDDFGIYTGVAPTTAPVLSVKAEGTQYLISWPTSVSGYVLESATSLTQSAWSNVSGVSANSVSIPSDSASRFFRLRKP